MKFDVNFFHNSLKFGSNRHLRHLSVWSPTFPPSENQPDKPPLQDRPGAPARRTARPPAMAELDDENLRMGVVRESSRSNLLLVKAQLGKVGARGRAGPRRGPSPGRVERPRGAERPCPERKSDQRK